MLRSLFSGITGLRAHQQMMDVTGNNIANVNTTGYKTQNAVFEAVISQAVKSPGAPIEAAPGIDNRGGVNGAQIGLGVALAGVNTNFGQGSAQLTGVATDFMIQGDGFFVANNGIEALYTRAGSFTMDANGQLVTPDGYIIQGWMADEQGVVDINAVPDDIVLPVSQYLPPVATTTMTMKGNLPSTGTFAAAGPPAVAATTVTGSITVYDSLGVPSAVTATVTKTAANTWTIDLPGADAAATVVFDAVTGRIASVTTPAGAAINPYEGQAVNINYNPPSPPAPAGTAITYAVDFTGLTQYASPSSFAITDQNGYAVGALTTFTTTSNGQLIGVYSNGKKQAIAQLAVAVFNNPDGLESIGDTMYRNTVNSGVPIVGGATLDGRGSIMGGTLEMSNVDLAAEFTNLIMAQRGFAANSRTLTASDEMLQELMNIKR